MAEALPAERDPSIALGWRRGASGRTIAGAAIVLFFVALALGAPYFSPVDPLDQDLLNAFLPPLWTAGGQPPHLFGTDNLGRDILARLLYGSQAALTVAVTAAVGAGLLGTCLGLLAGYYRGWLDVVVSRLVDMWMAFPAVLLSIVLVAVIGAGLHAVIIAIIVIDWTRFCRVVRAETLAQSSADYVASAVTIGMSRFDILRREILPNVGPLLVVLFTLEMGIAVVVEAILSFVGLSVSSDQPTWGSMIQAGRQYVNQAPWLMILPMLCVISLVLALNALGDGLRRALDPLLRA
jgi:dipeptide transport system permease protein